MSLITRWAFATIHVDLSIHLCVILICSHRIGRRWGCKPQTDSQTRRTFASLKACHFHTHEVLSTIMSNNEITSLLVYFSLARSSHVVHVSAVEFRDARVYVNLHKSTLKRTIIYENYLKKAVTDSKVTKINEKYMFSCSAFGEIWYRGKVELGLPVIEESLEGFETEQKLVFYL